MNDDQIHDRIEQLVSEEHALWQREAEGATSTEDRHRRDPLKVSLDQGWDLLGHRRALREAGLETEAARVCGPNVVEGYEQ